MYVGIDLDSFDRTDYKYFIVPVSNSVFSVLFSVLKYSQSDKTHETER